MTGTSPNDGILSNSEEILKTLIDSKENNSIIGIWAPRLGSGILMCKVDAIRNGTAERDQVIIVSEKNLQGENLQTHVLYLKEISQLHLFKKI
jgi:hypothetical protein